MSSNFAKLRKVVSERFAMFREKKKRSTVLEQNGKENITKSTNQIQSNSIIG